MGTYTIAIFILLIIMTLICLGKPLVKLSGVLLAVFIYGLFPYTYQGFTFIGNVKALYLSEQKSTGFFKDRYDSFWDKSEIFEKSFYEENYEKHPYLVVNCDDIKDGKIDEHGLFSGIYHHGSEQTNISVDLKKDPFFSKSTGMLSEGCQEKINEIAHKYHGVIYQMYRYIMIKSIVIMINSLIGFLFITGYMVTKRLKKPTSYG